MVEEVWEVVDQNYLDARGSGFDRARWAAVRTFALTHRMSPYHGSCCANKACMKMRCWPLVLLCYC